MAALTLAQTLLMLLFTISLIAPDKEYEACDD